MNKLIPTWLEGNNSDKSIAERILWLALQNGIMVFNCILLYDGQLHLRGSCMPAENTAFTNLFLGFYISCWSLYLHSA